MCSKIDTMILVKGRMLKALLKSKRWQIDQYLNRAQKQAIAYLGWDKMNSDEGSEFL